MEEESVKFYLAERVPFALEVTVNEEEEEEEEGVLEATASSPISWEVDDVRCAPGADGESSSALQLQLCEKLKLALHERELEYTIKLHCRKSIENGIYRTDKTEFRLAFGVSSDLDLGSVLKQVFGEEDVFLQAEIPDWQEYAGNGIPFRLGQEFKTKEMKLEWTAEGKPLEFVDDTEHWEILTLLPFLPSNENSNDHNIRGHMSLLLIVKGCGPSEGHKMAVYKRMLEEELGPDTVIVPSNEAEVKCHRGILSAQSDVFRTMLGTDMQEAKTRRIEMPDMSEEGVRAFLAYLYHWDLSKAEESCSVAVELLKAGHKYGVRFLEKSMRKLLLSKPYTWYEVDVAMKLFLFVWNFDDAWDSLKKKAVMVLKKNCADLKNSPTVQELFCENPQAAIAFCQYGFSL